MLLVEGTVADGEWECFECGRRIRLRVTPYDRLVLHPGAEAVVHFGAVGITLEPPEMKST